MRKIIIFTVAIFINSMVFGQQNYRGLLDLKKEVTYWDAQGEKIRSEGYLKVDGFSGVGERFGKWKFYYRNGNLEERSNYFGGKYNGEVIQFYPNKKTKFKGYFYLGVPDDEFKAYYENGILAEEGRYNSIADSIRDTTFKYWNIIEFLPAIKVGDWKTYYKNGKPWDVTHYKDGDTTEYLMEYYTPDGTHVIKNGSGAIKETFASGKPKIEKNYKGGLLNGKYATWNANGFPKEEGAYVDGKKEGQWVYYYFVSKGIYQKIGYKEGKKHGDFLERLPNDSTSLKGHYEYGKKDGLWEYYFENGQMDMTGEFENDLQKGHWKYYYPSGQLYYEGDYKNGKKTGEWQFYYNNGQLWREGPYRDDKKEGIWSLYYENGGDLMQGAFIADQEHGSWVSWYENGQEKDRGSYDHGQMTALWTGWYPNGKMRYEGNYERDMKKGKWSYYTSKGKLKDEGSYKIMMVKDGESVGTQFTLVTEQSYKHGAWKSYSDIDGKIVSEGSYYKGRQSGVWKYYYPGGKVVSTENAYNNKGKLDGTSKTYTRRGKSVTEINYKNGKKHGSVKTWGKRGKLIMHKVYKDGRLVKDEITKTTYKYGK